MIVVAGPLCLQIFHHLHPLFRRQGILGTVGDEQHQFFNPSGRKSAPMVAPQKVILSAVNAAYGPGVSHGLQCAMNVQFVGLGRRRVTEPVHPKGIINLC